MPKTIDVRLPSLNALLAFDAVARLGTFERAAQELAITASAVAKRLACLEELIGTPLLVRGAKPLALTTGGMEYLSQVRDALSLLASMPFHQRATRRRQKLAIRSTPTFARQILVPQLAQYLDTRTDIDLEIALSAPYADGTVQGEVDIEVGMADPLTSLAGQQLMQDIVIPMASPALIQELAPILEPMDLVRAPLLRTPLDPWSGWFEVAGLHSKEPDSGPKLLDLGLTLEAAVNGLGVALARPSLAQYWLQVGRLRPLLPVWSVPKHQYMAFQRTPSEAAEDFLAWLCLTCQTTAGRAQETLRLCGVPYARPLDSNGGVRTVGSPSLIACTS